MNDRSKQANCQQEPAYPNHETVIFSIRYPDVYFDPKTCTVNSWVVTDKAAKKMSNQIFESLLQAELAAAKSRIGDLEQELTRINDLSLMVKIQRELQAQLQAVTQERDTLNEKLNTPELLSFRDAVVLEAAHQRERWGSEHDDGKQPADWFWLVGYLAGKALAAHSAHVMIGADPKKALHHTISTAATLANWHAAILGKTIMQPGIMEPKV